MKIKFYIALIISALILPSCFTLTHEQKATHNAKKRYKNFKPADCGCKK